MDFTKVVNKRHSVRQFTDQAVETDLIKEIVTVAQRTPSWVNSQPWQVYCARGTVLQQIKEAYREADQTGQASQPDLPVMSREEWAPRTQANMKQWRHDIVHHFSSFDEAHTAMSTASNNLYDSPVILFITVPKHLRTGRSLTPGPLPKPSCWPLPTGDWVQFPPTTVSASPKFSVTF